MRNVIPFTIGLIGPIIPPNLAGYLQHSSSLVMCLRIRQLQEELENLFTSGRNYAKGLSCALLRRSSGVCQRFVVEQ